MHVWDPKEPGKLTKVKQPVDKLKSLRMKVARAEKKAVAAAEAKDKADKAWIRALMEMKKAQKAYAEEATKKPHPAFVSLKTGATYGKGKGRKAGSKPYTKAEAERFEPPVAMKTMTYVPCVVAYDANPQARARRAGLLDGFHGYPRQNPKRTSRQCREAYARGYAEGDNERHGRTKTVTNIMTGKEIEIPEDTPFACDPSNETYWSM